MARYTEKCKVFTTAMEKLNRNVLVVLFQFDYLACTLHTIGRGPNRDFGCPEKRLHYSGRYYPLQTALSKYCEISYE